MTSAYSIAPVEHDGHTYYVIYMDGAPIDQSSSLAGAREIVANLRLADKDPYDPNGEGSA